MAVEKFIRGKCDDAKHDGAYANRKRLEQAEYHLRDFLENGGDGLLADNEGSFITDTGVRLPPPPQQKSP